MAVDWTAGMAQSYEFVEIDPDAWTEGATIRGVESCTIEREDEGCRVSMELECGSDLLNKVVRVYLLAEQGDASERVALATCVIAESSMSTDGRRASYSATGYSPLYELDCDMPPIGWTSTIGVRAAAASLVSAHCRAPLAWAGGDGTVSTWTADDSDTWLDVLESLLAVDSMHPTVDGYGRIGFAADSTGGASAATFTDAAGSILYADATSDVDLADVPNTVEVVYSTDEASYSATATNDAEESATSTASRGYTVLYRDTDPDVSIASDAAVQAYADELLESLTCATRTLEYSHGFMPSVDVGTTVTLDYSKLGEAVQAVVVAQSIECRPGCKVDETAECEVVA